MVENSISNPALPAVSVKSDLVPITTFFSLPVKNWSSGIFGSNTISPSSSLNAFVSASIIQSPILPLSAFIIPPIEAFDAETFPLTSTLNFAPSPIVGTLIEPPTISDSSIVPPLKSPLNWTDSPLYLKKSPDGLLNEKCGISDADGNPKNAPLLS